MKFSSLRYLPLITCASLIIFGSSQPAVSVSVQQDLDIFTHKIAHLLEYAILYLTFIFAFYSQRKNYPALSLAGLLFVFCFGISDEFHQLFTPTRGPRVSDAFVDFFGAVVGYMLLKVYFIFKL